MDELDKAWIIKICREREELRKQVAGIAANHEDYARARRHIVGLQKQVDELRTMVSNREAEITRLKRQLAKMTKESNNG